MKNLKYLHITVEKILNSISLLHSPNCSMSNQPDYETLTSQNQLIFALNIVHNK